MTAQQITNARRIATNAELDAARAIMATVPVGTRLATEEQAAQALLGQCRPDCRCGDCPSTPFEIWAYPSQPEGLIGYVARLDYPNGQWVAMFPDFDDIMHDPQPVKRWSAPLPSFDHAEAQLRSNYRAWLRRQD